MSQPASNVATLRMPNVAPLRNVLLLRAVMEQLTTRTASLPGIGVFYGHPGMGKSMACAAAHSAHRGSVYIEVRDHFTKKSFLEAILADMAIKPERTAGMMFDQACDELLRSRRPLIVDMADYLVKRHLVDTLLDLYEGSGAPVLLVGEEMFPAKLQRESERFYDRVLVWRLAEFCDAGDARKLAALYSPDVEIKDDLLGRMLEDAKKIARRLATRINNVRAEAKKLGLRSVDAKAWGDRPFYTGDLPARRPS